MSEEGERTQRDLTKATKISSVNTRLLWTGVTTTNKKLQDTVENLVKLTKGIKKNSLELTRLSTNMQRLMGEVAMKTEMLSSQLMSLGKAFIKSGYDIAFTMTEASFQIMNSIGNLNRNLVRVVGTGVFGSEITQENLNELWKTANEGVLDCGDTLKEQIGYIQDFSQSMGESVIASWEERLIEWENSVFKSYEESDIWANIIKPGEGEEGEGLGALGDSKVQKGADKTGNFLKMFGLRMVLKGVEAMKALVKQIIDVAKSPFTEMFGDTLGGLVNILNSVLRPLKPFLFLLELIATVISAALTPLEVHLWEEFDVVIKELVGSIPELIENVSGWIENDEELAETIQNIINGVLGLVDAFVTGDLLKKLYDMSVNLLILAASLVTTDEDGITLIERFIELSLAITKLAVALTPLLDVIEWIVQALTGLTNLATSFWTEDWFGGGKPPGVSEGIPAPLPHLPIMQEGGRLSYTGAFIGHAGETVHKKGIDDEMLDMMSEMVYLQKRILKMKEERYR